MTDDLVVLKNLFFLKLFTFFCAECIQPGSNAGLENFFFICASSFIFLSSSASSYDLASEH
jgi:hypothetical protein